MLTESPHGSRLYAAIWCYAAIVVYARSLCRAMDQNQGAWNRFMNSMRARLNVAQIVEEVKQDATITFDFLTLLIIAG